MNYVSKFIIFLLLTFDVLLFIWILVHGNNVALLNPQGIIALQERKIIITSITLMLLVAIAVVVLTFFIAWKYRETNTKAKYVPDGNHKKIWEVTWWAIPTVIVLIMALFTWKSTHALDPYKPIESNIKPLTIQVVALRWKWLFIYPDQNIATVNFIQFPVHTPVNFELTADDAPMNSFWIPQLGGQMYAMTGMGTHLHLMADTSGKFAGSAAEISGQGFAGMKFIAQASSQEVFNAWVQSVKQSSKALDLTTYNTLIKPNENNPVTLYAPVEKDLYNIIITKYMTPQSPTIANPQINNQDNLNMMQGMEMK